ncbi:hypothetical protein BJY01DRAFT_230095 [Aspergillus pseudoustus]|uniref:Zn(2)-C6 fungal-type domain-containing protein n=1 Tax=Aspergillus pseudoustus TaxID=1810923 RepID=A0ABR4ID65_9EURO
MLSANSDPDIRRRKVRKGTQSCWECKRRKVRCIFASAEHAICNNCRRRGTACISQEIPEDRAVSSHTEINQLNARIRRLEALLEQSTHDPRAEIFPPVVLTREGDAPKGVPTDHTHAAASQLSDRLAGKYDEVCRELIAAWPNEDDLNRICSLPVGLSTPLYWAICTPYSGITGVEPPSPRDMLQLPPLDSHPVLIARKLLVLGTFLQGVPPTTIQKLGSFVDTYREIMARVFDRATRLVTTNDELTGSAEGLECILVEAVYQNYAGNLHRAWQAVSRAAAVAQMLGLHRGINSPSMKFLEPETRARFNPEYICFRLVQMDRYLSLMLGLPQTSLESRFRTLKVTDVEHPIESMERIHCRIAGRILSRTDEDINDLAKAYEIDKLIQDAAAVMSAQWWLVPRFSDGEELLRDTMRIMDQFTHHHLLVRLYMPYMLRSSSDHRYDHCKSTALNASREILTRFIAFRTSNPAHFYCRGTDFLAFVATTVMCLAHIDSRGKPPSTTGSPINFLVHSRPSDRGMMERASEIIESMANSSATDAIATKLTRILRHLLVIEANAANGTIYSTSSSTTNEGEHDGGLAQGGKALRIHIPYFGSIHFEKGSISKAPQTQTQAHAEPPELTTAASAYIEPHRLENQTQPSTAYYQQQTSSQLDDLGLQQFGESLPDLPIPLDFSYTDENWDLQGIDIALFDSLFRGTGVDEVNPEGWSL